MTFKDAIRDNLLQGFSSSTLSTAEILLAMGIAFLLAIYLFIVYRLITKNAFYSKNFNISMAAIALVTCGIIIAMQSSLVISLGMVGALSIVRFRTAIKEPMDLLFLFWSIGTGIICGTGLYKIAIIVAICVTVAILILKLIPEMKETNILFVSSSDKQIESKLSEIIGKDTISNRVKSRNVTGRGIDFVYEVRVSNPETLINDIDALEGINSVSLIEHEGEFRG